MKESKNNTILNQYLRETRLYCYYELKVARGDKFFFSAIEDHQDEGLPALAKEGLVWKLSDEDMRRKPCDGFCAPPLPAYLVIKFGDLFCFIEYEKIQGLKATGAKSIDRTEAYRIATRVFHTRL
jgi:hypothetical protein